MPVQPARGFRTTAALACFCLLALAGGTEADLQWRSVGPGTVALDRPAPLRIKCFGRCRVPEDRGQAYDPATGVFHIEFGGYAENGFDVVEVAKGARQPVKFHLTGLPDMYGFGGLPLTLLVDGKNYLIDLNRDPGDSEYKLIRDDALFRVENKFVTEYSYERPVVMIELTVAFTEKGRLLLKPGARIFSVMLTYW